MRFYTSIAKWYEYIFPFNRKQVDLLTEGNSAKGNFLDIGCATGNLCMEMYRRGYECTGIDFDLEFIRMCRDKNPEIRFICGNMLDIDGLFSGEKFDIISCLGNTLAHITEERELKGFFGKIYELLSDQGVFVCQILNYDRIINKKIKKLPLIENSVIRFERSYDFRKDGLLDFNTELILKNDNQTIRNSVRLNPLKFDLIEKMIKENGFELIGYYGSPEKSEFDVENSYPLIFSVKKILENSEIMFKNGVREET